jgi:ABC-2 type transport system ATP-binding protein
MAELVAVLENVGKTYGPQPFDKRVVKAIDGVTWRLSAGTVTGLLGPNRAGKTTLIRLLLSLSRPTTGTVTRFGQPAAARETLGRVGYVHESHAFPRYYPARQLLVFFGALSGVPESVLAKRVPALLERVGLADRADEPIARYSKGMLQRFGLAQAMVNEPDLLVLDEPSEGLDFDGQRLLGEVVAETRSKGKTVVLVSHSLPLVERLCDRLSVLRAGRVAFDGPAEKLTAGGKTLEAALNEVYLKAPA